MVTIFFFINQIIKILTKTGFIFLSQKIKAAPSSYFKHLSQNFRNNNFNSIHNTINALGYHYNAHFHQFSGEYHTVNMVLNERCYETVSEKYRKSFCMYFESCFGLTKYSHLIILCYDDIVQCRIFILATNSKTNYCNLIHEK